MIDTILYFSGIVFVAAGIGLSIGLHELGHLWPAKLFGIKVPKYAIGFGPTLFKRQVGETEYSLKLIPLGGFITMIGMYPPDKKPNKKRRFADLIASARNAHSEYVQPEDHSRMFYKLPVYKRAIIMFGGPFMNLILGFALIISGLSAIGEPQRSTTIEEVSQCIPQIVDAKTVPCDPATAAPSPATLAGLLPYDKILAINKVNVATWAEASKLLVSAETLNLTVQRGADQLQISVTPVEAQRPQFDTNGAMKLDESGNPILVATPVLGIVLKDQLVPLSLSASFERASMALNQTAIMLLDLPNQVAQIATATFGGETRSTDGLVSIVGVGQIAGEVASSNNFEVLQKLSVGFLILGSLNFALFAFNMVPLLPLDGGHIAGGVYEAVKRRAYKVLKRPDPGPADTALLMPLTYVVFLAIIALSLLLIFSDLVNPII